MNASYRGRRWICLPARGAVLVNTDLHGNGEDFRQMRARFEAARARDPETHWVILGDIVHAPSDSARLRKPELYGYPDESYAIAAGIRALQRDHPGRVHFVLGNHDYAHIGGPRTRKFYSDEAAALEICLAPEQVEELRALFRDALLAVLTPCGAFMSHGSPNESLDELAALDELSLPPVEGDARGRAILEGLLTAYGQRAEVTARVLERISRGLPRQRFLVHGHDRDEDGWFSYHPGQICVVCFGAPRRARRYLRLDLETTYESSAALREDVEILRVYDDA
ncbi:MAG: metallophosphoesterase [Myxococcales bacterium]|nr:metallophosphoesterase [Myxococcales bacterium]MCB9749645.1 metallophosphoesterase [Myxococcales bacterium]